MNPSIEQDACQHALDEYPKESCGLVLMIGGGQSYLPCRNRATNPQEHFKIGKEDWVAAQDAGEVVAVVHSHPDVSARPSEADLVSMEASGVPWYIIGLTGSDGIVEITHNVPQGYVAPLIGREFFHGTLDCLTLVIDYYRRELGIELGNYEREDDWWNNGQNLYLDELPKAGFYRVEVPQQGDIVLMQIRSKVPNHAGIFLEDGKLSSEEVEFPQPNCILHHLYNRSSRREVYGGYWQQVTVGYWRHKDV